MKNKKLKVEVINKYFYPVAAGIETYIVQIYGNLVKNGFDVTVHTSKDTLTEKNVLADFEKIDGLNVKRYKFDLFGFLPRFDWDKADIVCLNNFNIFPHFFILSYSLILKILRRKKFILILLPHGFSPHWGIFPKTQAAIKKFYQYNLGVFLINKTLDGIRAISEWEKKDMIKHSINPNLIKVINYGIEEEAFVDLEKFASKQVKSIVSRNQPYMIQVGRIHPIKNYETAIRALAKLPKNLNYLIVGPEQDLQYKKELEKLIAELGLQERVIFAGVLRGVDKYYLIKNAELMVHMALWESFCNVVHEGLSQGLVCIVANNTALPYLVKDGINGYCIETLDYKGVANKINFVLENKSSKVIKEMVRRNRTYGLKNSWERVAREIGREYVKILTNESIQGFRNKDDAAF